MGKGLIKTLQVGKRELDFSHLQFTNDIKVFCPQHENSIRNYKRLLQCFEIMSRLSINLEKSIIIPLNCEANRIRNMSAMLGCGIDKLPMMYLGIPLGG